MKQLFYKFILKLSAKNKKLCSVGGKIIQDQKYFFHLIICHFFTVSLAKQIDESIV
jgi:hypothetical protein